MSAACKCAVSLLVVPAEDEEKPEGGLSGEGAAGGGEDGLKGGAACAADVEASVGNGGPAFPLDIDQEVSVFVVCSILGGMDRRACSGLRSESRCPL